MTRRASGPRLAPRRWYGAAVLGALGVFATSCDSTTPPGVFEPPPAVLRRLTRAQYVNAVHDAIDDGILVTRSMEPDTRIDGFLAIGAAATSISPRGVEQYEALAYDVAEQALQPARRAAVVPCQPAGTTDGECAARFVTTMGRRVWRRPLTADETTELVAVATQAATSLTDFYAGLQFALAAMLQSPNFLFRVELGEGDATRPGGGQYAPWELASRLSFFLWDGPPDDALLTAAESGGLATDAGVAEHVTRMLASPRARRGLRSFVSQWLGLQGLDDLVKDPQVFTAFTADLGASAREETLADFERLVFELDGDYRDIFTTRDTLIDRTLAAIYAVPAPARTGFGLTTLPEDSPRRGLLGQASTLALHAHPVSTSPTLRGRFVRETLLCVPIPPPPVGVNTGIPEPSPELPTMRQRLASHARGPCRVCHQSMDPIGLGLENFDGIGRFRRTENDTMIDSSGELDQASFAGAVQLAQVVHDHPALGRCFTRRLFSYAVGHTESPGETAEADRLAKGFAASGYHIRSLMASIATSGAFRRATLGRQP